MKNALLLIVAITLISPSCFAQEFTLKSPDINDLLSENQVFSGFGCEGKNISPELHWQNAPKTAKSFAITLYDPDAPTGSGWWHWIIFDIPGDTTSLKSGAGTLENNLSPKGSIQSLTDFGDTGYGGACPPSGDKAHRYVFTVYALDIEKLGIKEKSSPALVGLLLNKHSIATSSIIAHYSR